MRTVSKSFSRNINCKECKMHKTVNVAESYRQYQQRRAYARVMRPNVALTKTVEEYKSAGKKWIPLAAIQEAYFS